MKAFHVYLNGKKLTTADVGDLGVLTALVTWVRRVREIRPLFHFRMR